MAKTKTLSQSMSISLSLLMTLLHVAGGEMTCKKITSCSCQYSQYEIIDLSPLSGKPKWSDQYDPQFLNMYSYNPCDGFSEGTCTNVAVCQNTGADYYDLGNQESASFIIDQQTGQLSVQYMSTDSIGVTRTSQIILTCINEGNDTFEPLGETSPGSTYYLFTLSSTDCCPKRRTTGNNSSAGLSLGTYISIGFFSVVLLYIGVGVAIQTLVKKQSGRDAIPNHDFWKGFSSLVKDGFVFVFTCGRRDSRYTSVK